ncbi:hypothetical protein ACHAWT_006124 [Skeletonema menzelii]|eukprot:scaffold17363_cov145-Skeletonema_menzelii.AAC.2
MKYILFLSVLPFFWVAAASVSAPTGRVFKPAFVAAPLPKSRAQSSVASTNQPDLEKFNNVIYASDDTTQMLRSELKARLLKAADDYAAMRAKTDDLVLRAKEFEEQTNTVTSTKQQRLVPRLLGKIVRKISRRDRKKSEDKTLSQSQGILTSDSFKQMKLDVGETGNKVIELAEQLSILNPTPNPTLGFKEYGGVASKENMLNGQWKLRFTTASDASFAASKERGVAATSQVIDAEKGTFTNVVDFEKGKLRGFRVVVNGKPLSNTDIELAFKSVKLLRESRFPRLFGEITIRLPSRLIRWLAARNRPEEERNAPYLSLKYLDEDLRIHTTDSNNWFVQSRIS